MVSRVTAWALWASGNDASAPKPCLNLELSSDEGFVGSNAAVQTSSYESIAFHNSWNKIVASQIFLVYFIFFLFSEYWWKIVNILIYLIKHNEILPWTMEQKIFCMKAYYERLFKQDTEESSISIHFQIEVRFFFKLVKNFEAHGNRENRRSKGFSTSGRPITIRRK